MTGMLKNKPLVYIGLLLIGFLSGFFVHTLLTPAPKSDIDIYSMLDTYQEVIPDFSYQNEDKALKLVRELQEVRDFKKRIEGIGKSKPIVAVDGYPNAEKPYYLVQVFEQVADNTNSFHTATFNWYRVDPKTWIVARLDLSVENEKWDIIDTNQ